jgi:hypothetical protein
LKFSEPGYVFYREKLVLDTLGNKEMVNSKTDKDEEERSINIGYTDLEILEFQLHLPLSSYSIKEFSNQQGQLLANSLLL